MVGSASAVVELSLAAAAVSGAPGERTYRVPVSPATSSSSATSGTSWEMASLSAARPAGRYEDDDCKKQHPPA